MNPMSYESLDAFMARVRKASVTGGKNITLTIAEAADLSAGIAQLMLRQNAILDQKQESSGPTDVIMNGGSFK